MTFSQKEIDLARVEYLHEMIQHLPPACSDNKGELVALMRRVQYKNKVNVPTLISDFSTKIPF